MRDSVPSARCSSVCNVLLLWRISLIPTYRVYRLYDKNVLKCLNLHNKLTAKLPVTVKSLSLEMYISRLKVKIFSHLLA